MNNNSYVDLHLHTCYSDGTFTPAELVSAALSRGFSAISITDHDSIEAISQASKIADETGKIEIVPGVELTAYDEENEVHILGYYVDYNDPWFKEKLTQLRRIRKERYQKIIEKLKKIGIDVSQEEFPGDALAAAYGRPHIAKLLLKNKYVSTIQEAFARYIGTKCPAYVEKERLSVKEVVNVIRRAKGIAILAHPGMLTDESRVAAYIAEGIEGIEVYHTEHSLEKEMKYLHFANERNLFVTGGSDCHGNGKREALIGKVKLPYKYLRNLKEAKGI